MLNTMSCFCSLIFIENFFCINRNYLLENQFKAKISNYISILTVLVSISALIFDIITDLDLLLRAFQLGLFLEITDLGLVARYRRNTFEALARLDEKCGINDEYFKNIKRKTNSTVVISLISVIVDTVGLYFLDMRITAIVVLLILFSAHDTELSFFTLLVDSINLRLSSLKEQHPNVGCRIYRHVLVVSAYINEEFTPRILIMLGTTLFTTVVYSFIIFLADPMVRWKLSVYLFWRETKSLYSLWKACSSAANTEAICRRLAFHLASRLALDPSISKEKNLKLHKTVRRWYDTVLSIRPRYLSGTLLTFDLGVPLLAIDISINYMIIIVQIYVAYK